VRRIGQPPSWSPTNSGLDPAPSQKVRPPNGDRESVCCSRLGQTVDTTPATIVGLCVRTVTNVAFAHETTCRRAEAVWPLVVADDESSRQYSTDEFACHHYEFGPYPVTVGGSSWVCLQSERAINFRDISRSRHRTSLAHGSSRANSTADTARASLHVRCAFGDPCRASSRAETRAAWAQAAMGGGSMRVPSGRWNTTSPPETVAAR